MKWKLWVCFQGNERKPSKRSAGLEPLSTVSSVRQDGDTVVAGRSAVQSSGSTTSKSNGDALSNSAHRVGSERSAGQAATNKCPEPGALNNNTGDRVLGTQGTPANTIAPGSEQQDIPAPRLSLDCGVGAGPSSSNPAPSKPRTVPSTLTPPSTLYGASNPGVPVRGSADTAPSDGTTDSVVLSDASSGALVVRGGSAAAVLGLGPHDAGAASRQLVSRVLRGRASLDALLMFGALVRAADEAGIPVTGLAAAATAPRLERIESGDIPEDLRDPHHPHHAHPQRSSQQHPLQRQQEPQELEPEEEEPQPPGATETDTASANQRQQPQQQPQREKEQEQERWAGRAEGRAAAGAAAGANSAKPAAPSWTSSQPRPLSGSSRWPPAGITCSPSETDLATKAAAPPPAPLPRCTRRSAGPVGGLSTRWPAATPGLPPFLGHVGHHGLLPPHMFAAAWGSSGGGSAGSQATTPGPHGGAGDVDFTFSPPTATSSHRPLSNDNSRALHSDALLAAQQAAADAQVLDLFMRLVTHTSTTTMCDTDPTSSAAGGGGGPLGTGERNSPGGTAGWQLGSGAAAGTRRARGMERSASEKPRARYTRHAGSSIGAAGRRHGPAGSGVTAAAAAGGGGGGGGRGSPAAGTQGSEVDGSGSTGRGGGVGGSAPLFQFPPGLSSHRRNSWDVHPQRQSAIAIAAAAAVAAAGLLRASAGSGAGYGCVGYPGGAGSVHSAGSRLAPGSASRFWPTGQGHFDDSGPASLLLVGALSGQLSAGGSAASLVRLPTGSGSIRDVLSRIRHTQQVQQHMQHEGPNAVSSGSWSTHTGLASLFDVQITAALRRTGAVGTFKRAMCDGGGPCALSLSRASSSAASQITGLLTRQETSTTFTGGLLQLQLGRNSSTPGSSLAHGAGAYGLGGAMAAAGLSQLGAAAAAYGSVVGGVTSPHVRRASLSSVSTIYSTQETSGSTAAAVNGAGVSGTGAGAGAGRGGSTSRKTNPNHGSPVASIAGCADAAGGGAGISRLQCPSVPGRGQGLVPSPTAGPRQSMQEQLRSFVERQSQKHHGTRPQQGGAPAPAPAVAPGQGLGLVYRAGPSGSGAAGSTHVGRSTADGNEESAAGRARGAPSSRPALQSHSPGQQGLPVPAVPREDHSAASPAAVVPAPANVSDSGGVSSGRVAALPGPVGTEERGSLSLALRVLPAPPGDRSSGAAAAAATRRVAAASAAMTASGSLHAGALGRALLQRQQSEASAAAASGASGAISSEALPGGETSLAFDGMLGPGPGPASGPTPRAAKPGSEGAGGHGHPSSSLDFSHYSWETEWGPTGQGRGGGGGGGTDRDTFTFTGRSSFSRGRSGLSREELA